MTRLNLAILISGRGSNMEALLSAAANPAYPAKPVLVASNRPDAKGLETAAAAGIPTLAIDHKLYGKDREAFERELDKALTEAGIEIIALAGFMRVLTPWFVTRWEGRMINIHPSLLPKYKGLDTHQRSVAWSNIANTGVNRRLPPRSREPHRTRTTRMPLGAELATTPPSASSCEAFLSSPVRPSA